MPAEALVNQVSIPEIALGCLFAVLLFLAATLFFKTSIKKYSSASS
ncbi:ABC-2 family transporter protein [Pseudobacteroides sp.]